MLTPLYITRTIAAGASERIGQYGRYITIWSISASTVTLSIGDEAPQLIDNGLQIDCEDRRYSYLTFTNVGGVPSTIILRLSETRITDTRNNALTAAIVALLTTIDADTGAMVVDLAAIEVLLTTMDGRLATIDADTGAMAVDLAAIEVLQTTMDGRLATIDTSLNNIEQEIAGAAAMTQLAEVNVAATGVGTTQLFAANANRISVEIVAPEDNAGFVYLGFQAANCTAADNFMVLGPGEVWWSDRYKGAIVACGSDANQYAAGSEI